MSEEEQTPPEAPADAQSADAAIEHAARAAEHPGAEASAAPSLGDQLSESDIETLLSAATFEDPVPGGPVDRPALGQGSHGPRPAGGGPTALDMPNLDRVLQEAQVSGIDLLRDVNLEVKVELGRSRMLVEDVLKLVEGSVVELDKLAGDPVEIFVNERLVARGEVLVLNDNFCVRVNEIVPTSREEEA